MPLNYYPPYSVIFNFSSCEFFMFLFALFDLLLTLYFLLDLLSWLNDFRWINDDLPRVERTGGLSIFFVLRRGEFTPFVLDFIFYFGFDDFLLVKICFFFFFFHWTFSRHFSLWNVANLTVFSFLANFNCSLTYAFVKLQVNESLILHLSISIQFWLSISIELTSTSVEPSFKSTL